MERKRQSSTISAVHNRMCRMETLEWLTANLYYLGNYIHS